MHWKIKAFLQNAIAKLPDGLGNRIYFRLQQSFGGFRNFDPSQRLKAGIQCWKSILDAGRDPINGDFFEVGTGWAPIIPLTFWLMGARSVVTVDLNRYLNQNLLLQCIRRIKANREQFESYFDGTLDQCRMDALLKLDDGSFSAKRLLETCAIRYEAPSDASATQLEPSSIDFHTSYNVLEHIPRDVLRRIIQEGVRIVKPHGLFIHRIDYSDHFSHSDSQLSPINFLKYTEKDWSRIAGNRFMFMNRMRHQDHQRLFLDSGLEIVAEHTQIDTRALRGLESGEIQLDHRFREGLPEQIAIVGGRIIARLAT